MSFVICALIWRSPMFPAGQQSKAQNNLHLQHRQHWHLHLPKCIINYSLTRLHTWAVPSVGVERRTIVRAFEAIMNSCVTFWGHCASSFSTHDFVKTMNIILKTMDPSELHVFIIYCSCTERHILSFQDVQLSLKLNETFALDFESYTGCSFVKDFFEYCDSLRP